MNFYFFSNQPSLAHKHNKSINYLTIQDDYPNIYNNL